MSYELTSKKTVLRSSPFVAKSALTGNLMPHISQSRFLPLRDSLRRSEPPVLTAGPLLPWFSSAIGSAHCLAIRPTPVFPSAEKISNFKLLLGELDLEKLQEKQWGLDGPWICKISLSDLSLMV